MKSPKVSVVIPTYNREKILHKTIESVLQQTYQDFELIIVDDGSTDNTKMLVLEYVEQYKDQVHYVYQEHKNAACARNIGIKHARGEYIAFLDSDDIWLPTKLEKQVNYLDQSDVGFVHTGRKLICLEKNRRHKMLPRPETLARDTQHFLEGKANIAMSVMVRTEVLSKVGLFDEGLITTQDCDLWCRITREFDIGFIDEILMMSYKYEDSLSTSCFEQKYKDRITTIRRMLKVDHPFLNRPVWKRRMMNHIYALAVEKYKKGKFRECYHLIREPILYDSFIGKAYFKDSDHWYKRFKKLVKPYWLMTKSYICGYIMKSA